jgi:hypothetical protein
MKKKERIKLNIKIIIISIISFKMFRMEILDNLMFLLAKLLQKIMLKIFRINKKISMKGNH